MNIKKYQVIAKVSSDKFVKYHVNNLLSFTKFLDEKFIGWRYFNVFDIRTGQQLSNFTTKCRPDKKTL